MQQEGLRGPTRMGEVKQRRQTPFTKSKFCFLPAEEKQDLSEWLKWGGREEERQGGSVPKTVPLCFCHLCSRTHSPSAQRRKYTTLHIRSSLPFDAITAPSRVHGLTGRWLDWLVAPPTCPAHSSCRPPPHGSPSPRMFQLGIIKGSPT